MKFICKLSLAIAILVVSYPLLINAQWLENGVPIAVESPDEENPEILPDGVGGAIIVWQSLRWYGDIFAQRIDRTGHILWQEEGLPVCTAPDSQSEPEIVSDGAGGAIIVWSDCRNAGGDYFGSDIFAQRIGPNGDQLWTLDGIPICTVQDSFNCADKSRISVMEYPGGAIITWHDNRTGSFEIYAQRIDTSGTVLWTPDGGIVCSETGTQNFPKIVPDGEGGAIIAWNDYRNDERDIYAQRIDMDGVVQWALKGVPVCTASGEQYRLVACTDGNGGAVLSWSDGRSGERDIYAQRISREGYAIWPVNGIPVCAATNDQFGQTITTDGSGGAIIAWMDRRHAVWYEHAIYCQRIFANGTAAWPTNGILIREYADLWDNYAPYITTDECGGAIITWFTEAPMPLGSDRAPTVSALQEHDCIFVQHVTRYGTTLWQDGGVNLWTLDYAYNRYPRAITDGDGGAYVTWYNNAYGIFVQRVIDTGGGPSTGTDVPPTLLVLSQNYPNPFNPTTMIKFDIRKKGRVQLRIYNVAG